MPGALETSSRGPPMSGGPVTDTAWRGWSPRLWVDPGTVLLFCAQAAHTLHACSSISTRASRKAGSTFIHQESPCSHSQFPSQRPLQQDDPTAVSCSSVPSIPPQPPRWSAVGLIDRTLARSAPPWSIDTPSDAKNGPLRADRHLTHTLPCPRKVFPENASYEGVFHQGEHVLKQPTTPLKAIRAKCLDCCLGQFKEIRLCSVTRCPLYPWRLGKRPQEAADA